MDRCGSCGGLAASFGKGYLRCVKTIGSTVGPAGCEDWSERQRRLDKLDRRHAKYHRREVRRYRTRVAEETGYDPYSGEKVN